jgi:hypothetical protein
VKSWSSEPASVLISLFTKSPRVRFSGEQDSLGSPHPYHAQAGLLALQAQGATNTAILILASIGQ